MNKLIIGFIMVSKAFLFLSCVSTSSVRTLPNNSKTQNDIDTILYFASLAGSTHNTQPWRVKIIDSGTIEIYADTARQLKVADPTNRGLFISLGAFIENMHRAAGALGYNCEINIVAQQSTDTLVAVVYLAEGSKTGYPLENLEKRATTRSPFETSPLEADMLIAIMGNRPNVLYFSSKTDAGQYITAKTIEAYDQQANNRLAQQELANWIRFSNSDIRSHRDGLTPTGMGITGFAGFIVRNFFKPASSKKQSFVDKGIAKTRKQATSCAGWLLITQPNNSPTSWVETGRIYKQINNACTQYGIAFHPMNQIIEEHDFEASAHDFLQLQQSIQLVARIGRAKIGKPASPRREVGAFCH